MIQVTIDPIAQTAKLTSLNTTVKVGADEPVQFVFSSAPGTLGQLAVALGSNAVPSAVLAYSNSFEEENATTYNALLDCSDTRLANYMAALGPTQVLAEVSAVINGVQLVFPNLTILVQPAIVTGPTTGGGGPTYYTQAQVNTLIAAIPQAAPVQTDLTPSAAGTAALFAATQFSLLRRRVLPGVGSGAYVADYTIPDAAQANSAIVKLNIEFPASANPTVTIHDNGGTLLSTFTNPEPAGTYYTFAEYYFDGAAWHELFRTSRSA